MAKQILLMTVGLPRSGKSTWARRQTHPIVCPDEIRLALHGQRFEAKAEPIVWAIAKIMVRALFGAGHHTVILDATNNTRKRRDEWKDDLWRRVYVNVNTTKEVCLARASYAKDDYIIPIIEKMAQAFEPIAEDEYDDDRHPGVNITTLGELQ